MSRDRLRYRLTTPVPGQVWKVVTASDPNAVVSQSWEWADCVSRDHRYEDISRLYEFDSGWRVIVPLARRRHLPGWAGMAGSWPRIWGVGGPIADGPPPQPAEARAVLDEIAAQGRLATRIQLPESAGTVWLEQSPQYRVVPYSTEVLDLDGGFGVVWKQRFASVARQAVRRAERSRVEVRRERRATLLPVFNELFDRSIRRWASQQHEPMALSHWRTRRETTESMLAAVAERFDHQFAVWAAYVNGEPVASIIVLSSGRYSKYWRGAMDKEKAGPVRANELLHRMAIEEACDAGYRYYEMGQSRADSTLARFKRKLGATSRVAYELRRERMPVAQLSTTGLELAKRAVGFVDY